MLSDVLISKAGKGSWVSLGFKRLIRKDFYERVDFEQGLEGDECKGSLPLYESHETHNLHNKKTKKI